MSEKETHPGDAAELRRRAEEMDRGEAALAPEDLEGLSPEEARRTLHELRVHQIELEMQNEELRRAQAELDASRARYFDLYDLAPVGYCTVSKEGLILEANLTAAGLLGVARGALVRQRLTSFILREDEDIYYHHRKQVFETGEPQACDLRMVEVDGTVFWVRLEATAAEDAGGEPVCRVVMSDITERKQAEEALLESEARYRSLFEQSGDYILVLGLRDGPPLVLDANQAALRAHGYSREEMVGQPISLIEPDITREAIEERRRRLDEGEPMYIRHVRKDGSAIDLEAISRRVRIGAREVVLTVERDITERKQVEEALRESEEKYRTVADFTYDWEYWISPTREMRYVSPSCQRITGHSAEQFVSDPGLLPRLIHPDDQIAYEGHLCEVLAAGYNPGLVEIEFRIIDCGGTVRWIAHGCRSVFGADGAWLGRRASNRDITRRKQAEEEKAKLEAQLRQAQRMESIGHLAGGVAHDFNNLLTVINGYSQMLLGELSADHPLRDALVEIYKAGERAAGLTRQLLAFSRKQVLQLRRLNVNQVVEEMRPMLERLVGEDVEVRVALHAESGTVHADPHQLEQVIMNLAVNARDAMPGGGKLLIETARVEQDESDTGPLPEARAGCYVMLAVSDDGVGMDEETKNRIFEPFFTTKGVGKGTGLGLSMVQGIVAQSGGYINVRSAPGEGTSFQIYLPALAEAAAEDWRPEVVPVQGGKETVLVVEDQAEVRKYAAAVLKSYGYRVIQAESAGEALLVRGRERGCIDLLLTDVVMPNVSGRELADRVETLQPGIKVLFMSGYTDNVIEHQAVLEKGAEFIQKPFSPEELARKVRAVLGPPAPAARILVVADDEAGVRGLLRAALEEGGHEVIEAADGKEALNEALAGRVDLVITDLAMPGQEEIETIQALRRAVPGVGIIAISGPSEGQCLETAQLLGADVGLSKPVSAELLLAKVAEVLKPRR